MLSYNIYLFIHLFIYLLSGFNQNAYIAQCAPGEQCGTFIEIHIPGGSPYQHETVALSDIQITENNVSGVFTTKIPLTWQGDPDRVLCKYTESFLRINSPVYVLPSAPSCCCPPPYDSTSKKGSFMCPYGITGRGPFATVPLTVQDIISVDNTITQYPYCLSTVLTSRNDTILMADYDVQFNRHFVRTIRSATINTTSGFWDSQDISGTGYTATCPYFNGCVLAPTGGCSGLDSPFTFAGQVGYVTAVETSLDSPVQVTFNGGRTSYSFSSQHLALEYRQRSMYELWWVVRTKSDRRIQKRKGFNVTSPSCTFDLTNNRYFPWASLNKDGTPIEAMFYNSTI